MYADVGGCNDAKDAKGPVVIYCCVCAQQRIPGLKTALQPVMNEH